MSRTTKAAKKPKRQSTNRRASSSARGADSSTGAATGRPVGKSAGLSCSGRCPWAGSDPLYVRYHDEEWGRPQSDDKIMFEKLILEGFQAGLSWITILRKRENFRKAFHQFDAKRISRYGDKDIERLMDDAGIVRNRLKIEATIDNAGAFLALTERKSLASFLWSFLPDGPIINARKSMAEVPGATDLSKTISKALKAKGFRFVGPTTIYAFMQSMGMVNDHLTTCSGHKSCAALQRSFKPPTC